MEVHLSGLETRLREVIDSHTFAGMLKVNLAEKITGSGEPNLTVSGLGYDDDRMLRR